MLRELGGDGGRLRESAEGNVGGANVRGRQSSPFWSSYASEKESDEAATVMALGPSTSVSLSWNSLIWLLKMNSDELSRKLDKTAGLQSMCECRFARKTL